jgi:hypothetical protein
MTTPTPPPSPPPPPSPQQPTPQPKKRGCLRAFLIICGVLVALFILLVIIGALVGPSRSGSTSSVSSTAAPTQEGPPISWSEVDSIYNLKTKNTNLQKDEEWKRFKGKRVVWSGIVSGVSDDWSGFTLQVKMNPDTFTFDLLIHLNKSEKPKAVKLHEGDTVRFSGRLESWGTLMPVTLDDGQILE